MTFQIFLLTLVAILMFLIYEDPNVAKFIELIAKLIYINIIRFFVGTKLRLRLEWDSFWLRRSMKKILKEKQKELDKS